MARFSTLLPLGMLVWLAASPQAAAADCPGNPDAIGISRVLVVDPAEHGRLGTMQYRFTLPLAEKEVVLTFDDGPLPPYSNRILDILAANCVKATYFIVGRMATAYPAVVRRIHAAGHTIGTHSQNHPFTFHLMGMPRVEREVEQGIASTAAALGDDKALAPFFRIPGLARGPVVEKFLADRQLMTWSADFPADDWRHISASEITRRALRRLAAKGKGILLLHDIQPATVIALPGLLKELKARGYRIVHVVPAGPDRPKTPTFHWQWVLNPKPSDFWSKPPRFAAIANVSLPSPSPNSFGIDHATGTPAAFLSVRRIQRVQDGRRRKHARLRLVSPWPESIEPPGQKYAAILPVPDGGHFHRPIVERMILALAPALAPPPPPQKLFTGTSRGRATAQRYRLAYAAGMPAVPIVPIASANSGVPIAPGIRSSPATNDAAAKPARLRHGLRSGQWPIPMALRSDPPEWLGP